MADDRPHTPPFRILVLADVAPPGGAFQAARIAVDKDNFDQVVARMCGPVRLRIGNQDVSLQIDRMAALRPAAVLASLAPAAPAGGAASAIDQVLAATPAGNPAVRAVLTHPDYVRLERAWRGLKFVVDRVDFQKDIKVELIASDKAGAPGLLAKLVRDPELELPADEPVSLVVADYEFDASAADQSLLAQLGELGMDLYAPVAAGVSESFLGVGHIRELARRDNVKAIFDGKAHDEWRSLREGEPSRWMVLGCNRFLLRAAEGDAPPLYGNPAWAVAVVCARRFAELRWCSQIAGPQTGAIASLPVETIDAGGRQVQLAVEAVLPDQVTSDLGDAGLLVLTGRANGDAAYILRAPTVHKHERYNVPAETEQSRLRVQLEHQLFVGRLAQQLESLARAVAGVDEAGVESLFEQAIAGMLKLAGRAAEDAALAVKVVPSQSQPDRREIVVNIRPGKLLLAGRVNGILLSFRLPQ